MTSTARTAAAALTLAFLLAACRDPMTPEPSTRGANGELVYVGPPLTFYFPATPQLTVGDSHACALRRDWVAVCWGYGADGRLGNGRWESSATPVPVADVLFKQISAGSFHTCGLDRDGRAYCWGNAGWAQIGIPSGAYADLSRPVRVATSLTFTAISAGGDHTCALTAGGEVYCWGTNYNGQTGDANLGGYSFTPARVTTGVVFKSITAGSTFTCGVGTDDNAYCWGSGRYTGAGDNLNAARPVPVKLGRVVSLSAGTWHACAVTGYNGGDAMCWGAMLWNESDYGMFGNGVNTSASFPVPTLVQGGAKWHAVSAGGGKLTCGLRRVDGNATYDRTVWCLGLGSSGQMGDGGTIQSNPLPVRVQLAGGVRSVGAGFAHACALTGDWTIVCWGTNSYGELGNGAMGGIGTTPRLIVGGNSFAP